MNSQNVQTALNQVYLACFGYVPIESGIPYTTSYKTEPLRAYVPGKPRKKLGPTPRWTKADESYLIECIRSGIPQTQIVIKGRSLTSIYGKIRSLRDRGVLNARVSGGA